MFTLIPYLSFNGNCREAMLFYQQCLGGDLQFQMLADSPAGASLPPQMGKYVLQCTLASGDFSIMGSDLVDEPGLIRGNSCAIMLKSSDLWQVRKYYDALSDGAREVYPLRKNEEGNLFGTVKDKYNNLWVICGSNNLS